MIIKKRYPFMIYSELATLTLSFSFVKTSTKKKQKKNIYLLSCNEFFFALKFNQLRALVV